MHGFDSRVIRIRWGRIMASTVSKKRDGGNNAKKKKKKTQLQVMNIRSVGTGPFVISGPAPQ